MKTGETAVSKELVLLGGGHAHVEVLRAFGEKSVPGVSLTLLTKDLHAPYSGMLPGLIAGHYRFDEAHIDLRPLAGRAGARIVNETCHGLDPEARRLAVNGGSPLNYDLLSINTGSTPGMAFVPGAAEHSLPVKPIDRFLVGWQRLQEELARRIPGSQPFRICVVGGGAGGVELLLSIREALLAKLVDGIGRLEFSLITGGATILPTHNQRVQAIYARILTGRMVRVVSGRIVERVTAKEIHCAGGQSFPYDALFWVTNASAPGWIAESGLQVDGEGFVAVNPFLQSRSHPEVFAAGDVASMEESPRPKSGVFAVRQGPPLAANLRAMLCGEPLVPYRPQRRFLSLISTGNKNAVASYGPFATEGSRVWRWKDWIDRKWMQRYQGEKAGRFASDRIGSR